MGEIAEDHGVTPATVSQSLVVHSFGSSGSNMSVWPCEDADTGQSMLLTLRRTNKHYISGSFLF
jgi:hypothetical protein